MSPSTTGLAVPALKSGDPITVVVAAFGTFGVEGSSVWLPPTTDKVLGAVIRTHECTAHAWSDGSFTVQIRRGVTIGPLDERDVGTRWIHGHGHTQATSDALIAAYALVHGSL